MVKTKEEYFGLRAALCNIVKDVNELQREKKIVVDGKEVPLDLFLGGDYKVSESLLYSILKDLLILSNKLKYKVSVFWVNTQVWRNPTVVRHQCMGVRWIFVSEFLAKRNFLVL